MKKSLCVLFLGVLISTAVFSSTLGIGSDFFLNEKITIEGMLKYYYEKQKPNWDGAMGGGHSISGIVAFFGI